MNLREDKHWAYGAFSFLTNALGQRPFMLYAPVQTDKTAESAAELLRESKDVIGPKPLTHDEIEKIKLGDVRSMPGEYQTTGAVLGAMTGIVVYDRPDDYVQTLKPRIEAQTDAAVQAAGEGDRQAGCADVGHRRRSQEDREAGARFESRRSEGAGCGRQGRSLSDSRFPSPACAERAG